jgi:hypothetical protein
MLREINEFEEFVEMGKKLSGSLQFSQKRTKYFQQTSDDQSAQDVTLSSSEEFRISTFLVIIDFFLLDLRKRIKACSKVDELFFLAAH